MEKTPLRRPASILRDTYGGESPMQHLIGHQSPLFFTPQKTEVDSPTLHYLQKKFANKPRHLHFDKNVPTSITTDENRPPITNIVTTKLSADQSIADLSPIPALSTPITTALNTNRNKIEARKASDIRFTTKHINTKDDRRPDSDSNTTQQSTIKADALLSNPSGASLLGLLEGYSPLEYEERVSPPRNQEKIQQQNLGPTKDPLSSSPFFSSPSLGASPFALHTLTNTSRVTSPSMTTISSRERSARDTVELDFGTCGSDWHCSRSLSVVNRYGCCADLLLSRIRCTVEGEGEEGDEGHNTSHNPFTLQVPNSIPSNPRGADDSFWTHSLTLQPMQSATIWIAYNPIISDGYSCLHHRGSFLYQIQPHTPSPSPPATKTVSLQGTAVENPLLLPPQILDKHRSSTPLTLINNNIGGVETECDGGDHTQAHNKVVIPVRYMAGLPTILHLSCQSLVPSSETRRESSVVEEESGGVFRVEPATLLLPADGKAEVFCVSYHPNDSDYLVDGDDGSHAEGMLTIFDPQTETTFSVKLRGITNAIRGSSEKKRDVRTQKRRENAKEEKEGGHDTEEACGVLEFGVCPVQTPVEKSISLENASSDDVLYRLEIVGDSKEKDTFRVDPPNIMVPRKSVGRIGVSFLPTHAGQDVTATLLISNKTHRCKQSLQLRGTAAIPTWKVLQSSLNFGVLEYYHKRRMNLALKNDGLCAVDLQLSLIGDDLAAVQSWVIEGEKIDNNKDNTTTQQQQQQQKEGEGGSGTIVVSMKAGEQKDVALRFEAVGYAIEDGLREYQAQLLIAPLAESDHVATRATRGNNNNTHIVLGKREKTKDKPMGMKRIGLKAEVGYSRLQVGRGTEKLYFSAPAGSNCVRELPIRNVGCIPLPFIAYFEEVDDEGGASPFSLVLPFEEDDSLKKVGGCRKAPKTSLMPGEMAILAISFVPSASHPQQAYMRSLEGRHCRLILDTSSASYCFELFGSVTLSL